MATYTVKKLIQYSVVVVVQAESESEAISLAKNEDGDAYHDDTLIDIYVTGVSEDLA
jgi:hypothetical protein